MAFPEQLRNVFTHWLQTALPIFEPLLQLPEQKLRGVLSATSWKFDFWMVNHWDQVRGASLSSGRLEQLPQTLELFDLIAGDDGLSQVFLVDENNEPIQNDRRLEWIVNEYLARFILAYLQKSLPLSTDFQIDAFEATYAELEEFILEPSSSSLTAFFQFRNVLSVSEDLETDRPVNIELAPGIVLRTAHEDELRDASEYPWDWHGSLHPDSIVSVYGMLLLEVTMRLTTLQRITDFRERQNAIEIHNKAMQTALTGLRLVDPAPIFAGPARFLPSNPFMFMLRESVSAPIADRFFFERARLAPNEEDPGIFWLTPDADVELAAVHELLRRIAMDERMEAALTRFDDSYSRFKPEDKLIDSWIGLEAVFASDGGGDLTYKIPLRLARFLGGASEDRIRLKGIVKKSYEARSKVVHGDGSHRMFTQRPIEQFASEAQGLLRDSIRKATERGRNISCTDLDSDLLG